MPTLIIDGTHFADTLLVNEFTYPGAYTGFQISGNDGDDVITVTGTTPAIITGDAGNDTLSGGRGNDTISGGSENDVIFGGRGDDHILGGSGNDIVNAGNGADVVFGGSGNDLLNGAGGNDYLAGDHGNDTINGGSGDDFIFGTKGFNTLSGGTGNDTINTGDHTSTANGGTGDDLIVARLKKGGDHVITGGHGTDTFEFVFQDHRKSSDVVITDFELGIDDLIIGGMDSQTWLEANLEFAETFGLDLVTEVNGSAVLNIGANDTITFEGISIADVQDHFEDLGIALG